MHISMEWLAEHVDLDGLDPATLADRLTMATAEVDGVETVRRWVEGVRVAEILTVEPIAANDGKRLTRVEIDLGDGRAMTVCGAPNARVGLKSAFAPAGTRLAGDIGVSNTQVAGHPSEGILCSPRELGLADFHDGILEIPSSVVTGQSLAELIPSTDTLLEIDNKSITHRPDLWGQYGFAREVAAVFGRELRTLPVAALERHATLPAYPLEVEDFDGCPAYCCIELDQIATVPSPLKLQYRLMALGQRSFDLLVDLTNYIMFELGQPMHAFDGSKLTAVRVAPMASARSFTTLDGQQRAMQANDLMIWNATEPVAIAGVMGGKESEVVPETSRLLLESANFRGSRIRRTATRLGLRTEASQRFEKSQPPANTSLAIARFLDLLAGSGQQAQVRSRLTSAGDLGETPRPLTLSLEALHASVGMRIPDDTIVGILRSLEFGAELTTGDDARLDVTVPPHRSAADIAIPADIVEEIARVYGYDNIDPRLPEVAIERPKFNDSRRRENRAKKLLAAGHGMTEIHTYSWFDDPWLQQIEFDPGTTLELANPSAPELARLRTTLVPNVLQAVRRNVVHEERFSLFELGRVFRPGTDRKCDETDSLVVARFARSGDLEAHYRLLRGAIEDLLGTLAGKSPELIVSKITAAPWAVAGQHVDVNIDGRAVGRLGVVVEPLLGRVAPGGQVVWAEIELSDLTGPIYPELVYDVPSVFPGSWLDFSVLWDRARGYRELCILLDGFQHELVTSRELVDLYTGKGLEKNHGSYSFRYRLGAKDRTLSGQEIEDVQKAIVAFIAASGLTLR